MVGVGKMFRLDFITMKAYFKSYIIFIIYPLIFASFDVIAMGIMMGFMLSMLSNSIFSVQEKNKLERLYGVMGISDKSLMGGRYLFLMGHCFLAIFVMIPLHAIARTFLNSNVTFHDIIMAVGCFFFCYWLITSLQTPLSVRFGYTKSRMWGMLPFLIVAVSPFLILNLFKDSVKPAVEAINAWYETIATQPVINCLVLVAAGLVFAIISYVISLRCYRGIKK